MQLSPELMKHTWLLKRVWLLPVLLGVLIAAHGVAISHLFSRVTWTIALGVVVLALLTHVGVFGPIYAFFRGQFRRKP